MAAYGYDQAVCELQQGMGLWRVECTRNKQSKAAAAPEDMGGQESDRLGLHIHIHTVINISCVIEMIPMQWVVGMFQIFSSFQISRAVQHSRLPMSNESFV